MRSAIAKVRGCGELKKRGRRAVATVITLTRFADPLNTLGLAIAVAITPGHPPSCPYQISLCFAPRMISELRSVTTTAGAVEVVARFASQSVKTALFLYLSYQAPHSPLQSHPSHTPENFPGKLFGDDATGRARRQYAGMVQGVDEVNAWMEVHI